MVLIYLIGSRITEVQEFKPGLGHFYNITYQYIMGDIVNFNFC